MIVRFFVLGAALVAVGCSTMRELSPHAFDPTVVALAGPAADDPKDADAIILRREARYLVMNPRRGDGYSEQQLYQTTKILTEAGYTAASEQILLWDDATLVDLRARTITKDGVFEVDSASVLADSATIAGKQVPTRSVRFPRVEVGAILELSWTLRSKGVRTSLWDRPAERWPVRVYDAEIVVDRFTQPDLLVNNVDIPLGYTKDADGTQHLKLHIENLKSSASESWRPTPDEIDPWWLYRTIAWRYPDRTFAATSTWGRALRAMSMLLIDGEGDDGPDLRVVGGASSCAGDATCLIDAALAQVRDDVAFSGFDRFFNVRPLSEVVAGSSANNHEKAVYLWSLLKKAGLSPQLAVLGRNHAPVNESFPSKAWIDHTVVWVPPSTTRPAGTWIDPSCEHCAAGELPAATLGSRAATVAVVEGDFAKEIKASDFAAIVGRAAPPSVFERRIDATVDVNGDLKVTTVETAIAGEAMDLQPKVRTAQQKDADADALARITRYTPAARVVDATPWRCDRVAGRCTWQHTAVLPAWATLDTAHPGVLLLPLPLLPSGPERILAATRPRTQAVVHDEEVELDEEVRVTPPPGFSFDLQGLKSGEARTEGFSAGITVAVDQGVLVVRRRHRWTPGRWDKAHYADIQQTMKVSTATTTTVVRLVPPS